MNEKPGINYSLVKLISDVSCTLDIAFHIIIVRLKST